MSEQDDNDTEKVVKISIVGDGASGKSSLAMRFTQEQFDSAYQQTVGLDFFLKRIRLPGLSNVTVQVRDIGGQTLGGRMLDKYVYGSHGIMFVYDITKRESFENLKEWLAVISKCCRDMQHLALIGNKVDQDHMRNVKADRHQAFAAGHGMSSHFVSAKTGDGVNLSFHVLVGDVLGVALGRADREEKRKILKAEIALPMKANDAPSNIPQMQKKSSMCTVQ